MDSILGTYHTVSRNRKKSSLLSSQSRVKGQHNSSLMDSGFFRISETISTQWVKKSFIRHLSKQNITETEEERGVLHTSDVPDASLLPAQVSRWLEKGQKETMLDQPCLTPSIPVKFLTKVIPSSERKGFNSQTKRFQHTENENPGPGCYNIIHQSALLNNVSQSQKGTCFFPSLDVRIARQRIPKYPAANAYNLPPTLKSKRDFSLGHSSMFHQPIARKITKKATPAPNQYNVTVEFSKQSSGPAAQSAFVSGTKRSLSLHGKEQVPSPCHYQVNESFIRQSPMVLVSCFKSKTTRETHPETLSPGPAAYQNPAEVQLTASRKFPGLRKFGLNFSAPAVLPPKNPPPPGPGQYEIVDFDGPDKHYISSAVFVSNTGRWAGDKQQKEIPGPGAYNLPIPQKQSFIYNTDNKWLPVL